MAVTTIVLRVSDSIEAAEFYRTLLQVEDDHPDWGYRAFDVWEDPDLPSLRIVLEAVSSRPYTKANFEFEVSAQWLLAKTFHLQRHGIECELSFEPLAGEARLVVEDPDGTCWNFVVEITPEFKFWHAQDGPAPNPLADADADAA